VKDDLSNTPALTRESPHASLSVPYIYSGTVLSEFLRAQYCEVIERVILWWPVSANLFPIRLTPSSNSSH